MGNKIAEFIIAYENCKNYNWEELNVPAACDCGIGFPDIPGTNIRVTANKLQFIKGNRVIYEHMTSPESPRY